MDCLLDTVTVSELRRGTKARPGVVRWQRTLDRVGLSVSTLNEIRYGMRKVERSEPPFVAHLVAWYANLLAQPERGPPHRRNSSRFPCRPWHILQRFADRSHRQGSQPHAHHSKYGSFRSNRDTSRRPMGIRRRVKDRIVNLSKIPSFALLGR